MSNSDLATILHFVSDIAPNHPQDLDDCPLWPVLKSHYILILQHAIKNNIKPSDAAKTAIDNIDAFMIHSILFEDVMAHLPEGDVEPWREDLRTRRDAAIAACFDAIPSAVDSAIRGDYTYPPCQS